MTIRYPTCSNTAQEQLQLSVEDGEHAPAHCQHIKKINKLSEVNGVDEVWHCNLRLLLIAFISIYEDRYVSNGQCS